MLNKNPEHRENLFRDIKEVYEADIVTYNLSAESLPTYQEAYSVISTLLGNLDTDRGEIRFRLGREFETWFYEIHDTIINQLWDSPFKGIF